MPETTRAPRQSIGRLFLRSLVLTLVSLGAAAAAVVLADFGASLPCFLLLLAWLLTVGLPSTLGILLVASLWGRGALTGLPAFGASAAAIALLFQLGALGLVARIRARLRSSRS